MITGVLKANPGKTSLPFKLLASLSTLDALTKDSILQYPPNDWSNVWTNYTYVLMDKGRSQSDLQHILNKVSEKQYPKGRLDRYAFEEVPLTDIMPADPISNATNVGMPKIVLVILSVLCLIVMLSACLNYTNLSLARQLTRAKEVGIRKVSGASRKHIFTQFITEAVLVSLLSLILSAVILFFLQRLFSGLWLNRFLDIAFAYTPGIWLIFVGFSVVVGVIAGLLPSIYISLFDAAQVLKGLNTFSPFKRLTLRKVLLVVQSGVSLIFIISASLIYLQTQHILHFKYGFDKENVVNIKLFKTENYDRYAHIVAANKNVAAIGACSFPPATGNNNRMMVHKVSEAHDSANVNFLDIDAGCVDAWGLQIIAGKSLPTIAAERDDRYVLINEKMVSDLKFASPQQAVGQHMILDKRDVEIAGVVKNFQFLDVTRQMEPLMLRNRKSEFGYMTVKLQGRDVTGTLAFLQNTWKQINPSSKFEYEFFDQQLMVTHAMMSDKGGIVGVLAILAVLISCLGLLGMATYTVETRRKEVSVRKVLGSSVLQVVMLLSRSFVYMLGIAIVIAVPIAMIVNNIWLESFASRVTISPGLLLIDAFILVALSMLVVFSQAWRISRTNPAHSLRSE